jgi:hypothetical protein
MSSGVSRVKVGSYIGTGAALNIDKEKVGFKPQKVEIHRVDTAIDKAEHIDGMADASMFLTTGSTGVRTLVTTEGITLKSDGFTLGTDATVNNAADRYRYVAWE